MIGDIGHTGFNEEMIPIPFPVDKGLRGLPCHADFAGRPGENCPGPDAGSVPHALDRAAYVTGRCTRIRVQPHPNEDRGDL